MATIKLSAYPDGNTTKSNCSFSANSTSNRTNATNIQIGSTKAKAVYKGNVQVWPEVKTLVFKNINFYTETKTFGDSTPEEYIGDLYIMHPLNTEIDTIWKNKYYFSGSDFIHGIYMNHGAAQAVNYYGNVQRKAYTRHYFICDIYNTNNQSVNVGSTKIYIPMSAFKIKWKDADGTVYTINTSTRNFGVGSTSDAELVINSLDGSTDNSWCYMQNTKLYYSPGWDVDLNVNGFGNPTKVMGGPLPDAKPVSAILTRKSPMESFSSTNLSAVVNGGILHGVTQAKVLKNFALSFGFEDVPADSSSSTPYTSYILKDTSNSSYLSWRYIFNGCSWDPSCVSYYVTVSTYTSFSSTFSGDNGHKIIVTGNYNTPPNSVGSYGTIPDEGAGGTHKVLNTMVTGIYFESTESNITECNEWRYPSNSSNGGSIPFDYPKLTLQNGESLLANSNGTVTGKIGVSNQHTDYSYTVFNNREYTFNSNNTSTFSRITPTMASSEAKNFYGAVVTFAANSTNSPAANTLWKNIYETTFISFGTYYPRCTDIIFDYAFKPVILVNKPSTPANTKCDFSVTGNIQYRVSIIAVTSGGAEQVIHFSYFSNHKSGAVDHTTNSDYAVNYSPNGTPRTTSSDPYPKNYWNASCWNCMANNYEFFDYRQYSDCSISLGSAGNVSSSTNTASSKYVLAQSNAFATGNWSKCKANVDTGNYNITSLKFRIEARIVHKDSASTFIFYNSSDTIVGNTTGGSDVSTYLLNMRLSYLLVNYTYMDIKLGNSGSKDFYRNNARWDNPWEHRGARFTYVDNVSSYTFTPTSVIQDTTKVTVSELTSTNYCYYDTGSITTLNLGIGYLTLLKQYSSSMYNNGNNWVHDDHTRGGIVHKSVTNTPIYATRYVSGLTRNYTLK